MMMLPGITAGQTPSVNASVSESVRGSASHEGNPESVGVGVGVLGAGRGGAMFVIVKVKEP